MSPHSWAHWTKCWWSKSFKPKPHRTSLILSGKKITQFHSILQSITYTSRVPLWRAWCVCACVCDLCSLFNSIQSSTVNISVLHSSSPPPHYLHGPGCIWVPPHHRLYRSRLCWLGVQQGPTIIWATSALSTLLRFALAVVRPVRVWVSGSNMMHEAMCWWLTVQDQSVRCAQLQLFQWSANTSLSPCHFFNFVNTCGPLIPCMCLPF